MQIPPRLIPHIIRYLQNKNPLLFFICARLLTMLVMLFFLGLALFALLAITPGDIVENYTRLHIFSSHNTDGGGDANSNIEFTDEMIARAKHELGLDLPFYKQYARWLKQLFINHDLGTSLVSRTPILFLIRHRLINSFVLAFLSLIVLTVVSFSLSLFFTRFSHTRWDGVILTVTSILRAIPQVFLFLLLQFFAAITGLFPVTAYPSIVFLQEPIRFIFSYGYHVFLPILGAFIGGIGGTMRYVRATLLDQLGQPYITVLRSRGIHERRIRFAHAFKNTLNPYITSSSDLLASLFSGSLLLEVIFNYPGVGSMMLEAIQQEDVNLVIANMMFISFLVLLGMILSDIALAFVDPRIRYGKR